MATSELGERLKRLRLARNLTLKQVEERSKVSATHLSEIERGKTSPTVGALRRIARALGEPAARLVDDDSPPRVSVVRRDERTEFVERGATFHRLTRPIAVEELSLFEVDLPDGRREPVPMPAGARETFVFVRRGAIELDTGAQRLTLKEGDACHVAAGESSELRGIGSGGATVLCAASPRVPI